MNRVVVVLAVGVLSAALGIAGLTQAHEFATLQQATINGTFEHVNTEKESAYRLIGSAFLVFGLGMVTLASHRWMGARGAIPTKDAWAA